MVTWDLNLKLENGEKIFCLESATNTNSYKKNEFQ